MIYYTCVTCPPHSTMDHDLHGTGPCLMPGCKCTKMVDGAEFFKEIHPRVPREESLRRVAERLKKRDARYSS